MKHSLVRLPNELKPSKHSCRAVVETPKGSRWKMSYDPETGTFEASNLLPDGMSFPMDFGFVPSTRAEDGDPTDILILSEEPLPMGALVTVRLIGVIEGEQTEADATIRNDRLLGVAEGSHLFEAVQATSDLPDDFLKNIERFWVNYNALKGRKFKVVGVRDAEEAAARVRATAQEKG